MRSDVSHLCHMRNRGMLVCLAPLAVSSAGVAACGDTVDAARGHGDNATVAGGAGGTDSEGTGGSDGGSRNAIGGNGPDTGGTGGDGTGGNGIGGASTGGVAGSGGDGCGTGREHFQPAGCGSPTVDGCYETCDDGICTTGQCLEVVVMPSCAINCTGNCCNMCAVGESLCVTDDHAPLCGDYVPFPPLSWGLDGGVGLYRLSSSIESDGAFLLTRTSYDGSDPMSCAPPLPDCGSPTLDLDEITRGVVHHDVQEALRTPSSPLLFGYDSRPVDGVVTRISVGGAVLEVGEPCGDRADCDPIPPGIALLVQILNAVTDQQEQDVSCDGVRAAH